MDKNGFSDFTPGQLYEWACYLCKVVSENCNVTEDLANLMATYRDEAKFGDRIATKGKLVKQWEKELGPRFFKNTCYLHDRAAKGKDNENKQ